MAYFTVASQHPFLCPHCPKAWTLVFAKSGRPWAKWEFGRAQEKQTIQHDGWFHCGDVRFMWEELRVEAGT